MNSLEMKSPGLAGTKTGAGTEGNTRESSTDRSALQETRQAPSILIRLAAWLVRLEKGKLERKIPVLRDDPSVPGDPGLSLQLDQLLEISERLADYRNSEWRRP